MNIIKQLWTLLTGFFSIFLSASHKVLKEYENDPTKGIKQIQMGGTSIILTGKDGTSTKIAKEQEERLKARIKKDNNRIELDIVK